MHSGSDAFICIPHDSACSARAPLGSGSIQVHSCAFMCIHIHSYTPHHLPHSYSHECNGMYAKCTTMHSNTFELDQLVSSEVVQILIVAAVNVIRVLVVLVLVVLHCIITGLDVGATYSDHASSDHARSCRYTPSTPTSSAFRFPPGVFSTSPCSCFMMSEAVPP